MVNIEPPDALPDKQPTGELVQVLAALNRIASAFEEHNSIQHAWVAYQKQCHDEGEALTEKRYQEHVKRQEEETTRMQRWHDEAERLTAQRQQEQVERDDEWRRQQIDAYLAGFKSLEEVKP